MTRQTLILFLLLWTLTVPAKTINNDTSTVAVTYLVGQLNDHLEWDYCLFEFDEVGNSVENKRIEFIITNTTADSFRIIFNKSSEVYKYGQLINLNGYKIKVNKSETLKKINDPAWQSISTLQYKIVCSKLIHLHGQEYKKADLLLLKHLYKEAEEAFTNLISAGLEWPEIYYSRALTRIELNKTSDALKDLNKTIELYPNLKIAYEKRANVERQLGDIKSADADEQKYKTIDNRLNKTNR